jgi:DNA damage-binding protein 1
MTEVEMLSDDTFIGAETNFNIFVCKRDSKATNEQERAILQQVGLYHLGDSVNVMRQGTLVVQHPSESSLEIKRATLFGTVDGVVGLILTIDEALFKKLERIQNSLTKMVKSIGKIDHSDWRAFKGHKSSQAAIGFVDGDLIETFLDLTRAKMEQVARDTELPVEEVIRTIEELSRLH